MKHSNKIFLISVFVALASCNEPKEKTVPDFDEAYATASKHIGDSIELSFNACKTAIELAEKNRSAKLLGKAYWMMGYLYFADGKPSEAIHYYDAAADVYKFLKEHENCVKLLENGGSTALNADAFDVAYEKYRERLAYVQEFGGDLANAYHDLALALKGLNQLDSANHYNVLALDLTEDNALKSDIFNELGIIQFEINQHDSARYLYREAEWLDESVAKRFKVATNIANSYYAEGKLTESMEWYNKALTLAKEMESSRAQVKPLNSIGICYYDLKQTDSAFVYFQRSVEANNNSLTEREKSTSLGLTLATNYDLWVSHDYLSKIDSSYARRIADNLIVSRFSEMMSNYNQMQKQQTVRAIQLANSNRANDKLIKKLKEYQRDSLIKAIVAGLIMGLLTLGATMVFVSKRKSMARNKLMLEAQDRVNASRERMRSRFAD